MHIVEHASIAFEPQRSEYKHDERVSTLAIILRKLLNRRWPPLGQGALCVRQGNGDSEM
jgi:hypothetical protein